MSKTTVSTKHVRSTATSLRGATRSVCTKWRTSHMFHATSRSSPASAAIGTYATSGAATRIVSEHEERVDDRRDRRASRRRGCSSRCARARRSRRCRRRTAQDVADAERRRARRSDRASCRSCRRRRPRTAATRSRRASRWRARATRSSRSRESPRPPSPHGGRWASAASAGSQRPSRPPTTVWNREPIVATWKPGRHARRDERRPPSTSPMATSGAGTRARHARPEEQQGQGRSRDAELRERDVPARLPERRDLLEVAVGHLAQWAARGRP